MTTERRSVVSTVPPSRQCKSTTVIYKVLALLHLTFFSGNPGVDFFQSYLMRTRNLQVHSSFDIFPVSLLKILYHLKSFTSLILISQVFWVICIYSILCSELWLVFLWLALFLWKYCISKVIQKKIHITIVYYVLILQWRYVRADAIIGEIQSCICPQTQVWSASYVQKLGSNQLQIIAINFDWNIIFLCSISPALKADCGFFPSSFIDGWLDLRESHRFF